MPTRKVQLTAEQRRAGRAAMRSDFTRKEVEAALLAAGVSSRGITVSRAADLLLVEARDAGEVSFVFGKLWRAAKAISTGPTVVRARESA